MRRWLDGTTVGATLNSRLASLSANDDLTFKLVLKEPFGLVEFMLAGAGAPIPAIMPEKDASRPESEALTAPIGSGPFRYVASERVELSFFSLTRGHARVRLKKSKPRPAETTGRERQGNISAERLIFVDQTWAKRNMTHTHGRCAGASS